MYLGHTLSGAGLAPDPDKVKDLKDARPPTNVSEVRSFCGFVSYYVSFLQGSSTFDKKWCEISMGRELPVAFQKLKTMLTSDTMLTHFDSTKRIKLACDASAYGVGAVLSHVEQNGVERPICCASRTMTKAEQNYSQLERESLSKIFGISKFHDYLWGHHFVIETDHQPLVKILGECTGIPTIASSHLQRWALKLAAHTYNNLLQERSEPRECGFIIAPTNRAHWGSRAVRGHESTEMCALIHCQSWQLR